MLTAASAVPMYHVIPLEVTPVQFQLGVIDDMFLLIKLIRMMKH